MPFSKPSSSYHHTDDSGSSGNTHADGSNIAACVVAGLAMIGIVTAVSIRAKRKKEGKAKDWLGLSTLG